MAELDKLIRINIDYENSLVKINEVEVALTDLAKAESLLTKTLITSSESRVRSEAQIQKEINALKQEQKSVAETTVQYGQFSAQIKQLELELAVLRGTAIRTADGIITLKEKSEQAALAQKELAQQTALAQKEAAAQAEQARISQEKLNNTFIVANKDVMPQSINSLRDQIRFTEQLRLSVDKTSFEYVQHTRTLERLNAELKAFQGTNAAVSSGFNQMKNSSGLASQTLVEVGRTVSDANYGFTAVANNLSQLSYYFVALVGDSKGVVGAFKNLGRQLLGAGGVVIAIQLVITLIERYTLSQREANRATDDFNKSMSNASGSIKTMEAYASILKSTNSTLEEQKLALSKLKKEGYDPLIGSVDEFIEAKKKLIIFNIQEEQLTNELKKLYDKRIELEKSYAEEISTWAEQGNEAVSSERSGVVISTSEQIIERRRKIAESYGNLTQEIFKEEDSVMAKMVAQSESLARQIGDNPFFDSLLGDKDKTKNSAERRLAAFKKSLFDLSSEMEKYRQEALKDNSLNAEGLLEQDRAFAIAELEIKKQQYINDENLRRDNYIKQLNEKKSQAEKNNKWTEEDEENYRRLILESDETLKSELLEAESEFLDARLMLNAAFDTELQNIKDEQQNSDIQGFVRTRRAIIDFQRQGEIADARTEVERLKLKEQFRQEDLVGERIKLENELAIRKQNGEAYSEIEEQLRFLDIENTRKTEEAKMAIRKASLDQFATNIDKAKEYVQALASFIDADFEAQKQKEENKTNAANNELRARLSNENLSKEEKEKINQQIAANDEKLRLKQEAIEKKRFKTDKAFRISMALMDTASSALKAYGSQLIIGDPSSIIRAQIAAAAATALGLAQVAMIAKQQFQTSASSAPPSVSTGGGVGEATPVQAPDFNIVGQSNVNQLAQLVQSQLDRPLKTYVVAKDVTTAQELDRNRVSAATI